MKCRPSPRRRFGYVPGNWMEIALLRDFVAWTNFILVGVGLGMTEVMPCYKTRMLRLASPVPKCEGPGAPGLLDRTGRLEAG